MIVVFIIYRNKHLIKASSRELSSVLLCGVMLCYLLPFVYIAKPSPASCAIRRFGVGFCFSLCFSALLVKTSRIHCIFNRKSLTLQAPPLINPQSQLFFTALLVSIQVLIAVVWLVVEPPNTIFLYERFHHRVALQRKSLYWSLSDSSIQPTTPSSNNILCLSHTKCATKL